jgi:hypothetical protein
VSIHRVGPKKGSSFLLQARVLPADAGTSNLSPAYRDLGWPSCINATRPVIVVHTDHDYVTGTMRLDPTLKPDQVRLTLSTISSITWWKGVEIVREVAGNGPFGTKLPDRERFEVLTGVYTQEDYHGPDTCDAFQLDVHPGRNLYLQFRKAGEYGVHTTVCRIPLHMQGGHSLNLTWHHDGSPSSR